MDFMLVVIIITFHSTDLKKKKDTVHYSTMDDDNIT